MVSDGKMSEEKKKIEIDGVQINDIRFKLYIEIFDELNKIFDACAEDCFNRIDKARMDTHELLDKASQKYGNIIEPKPNKPKTPNKRRVIKCQQST